MVAAAASRHPHAMARARRDLKCDNLLLDATYTLKVADFGLCMVTDSVFTGGRLPRSAS
jgi:serine/threonine protein kinase